MIIGELGCGKASLLKAISGQLNTDKKVYLSNSFNYCPGSPQIFSLSIKDNIVLFRNFDE